MLVIFLAVIGIGIAGGVPLPLARRKENDPSFKIELVESNDNARDEMEIEKLK